MFRPHDGKNAQLGKCRGASENIENPAVLLFIEPVLFGEAEGYVRFSVHGV